LEGVVGGPDEQVVVPDEQVVVPDEQVVVPDEQVQTLLPAEQVLTGVSGRVEKGR
jgi:hypothetical protein